MFSSMCMNSNYMVLFTLTYPVQRLYSQVKGYYNHHDDIDHKTKFCYVHISSGVVELQGEKGGQYHIHAIPTLYSVITRTACTPE